MNFTEIMPKEHAAFLEHALSVLRTDERITGIAIGGSFVSGRMDEFSDIDLVLVIDPPKIDEIMPERWELAARLGCLVDAFTGEHVGEPRLLICLYDQPVLHVDLKFVSLADVAKRVEDPALVWDRQGRVAEMLATAEAHYPAPDLQWIEERFWPWVHYISVKIGRGELFEVLDGLAFLRARVLGPLVLMEAGARPSGVRKIEMLAPARARELARTVAPYDRDACAASLYATINLYKSLRETLRDGDLRMYSDAERVAMDYLAEIAGRDAASIIAGPAD
jgi:predicted nucleotidyltransferase